MEIINNNINKYNFKSWKNEEGFKTNSKGYAVRNLNLNPDDQDDLIILNALDNLEDVTMSAFIRKALLSYIENENTINEHLFNEKEIKSFARDDVKKFIRTKEFENQINNMCKDEINEMEHRLKIEIDKKFQIIYNMVSALDLKNLDK